MKIDLSKVDLDNFLIHPHIIAGETCWLIQAKHIGTKWTKDNLIFRSSVWNSQGEPVSLSFKKFFNWSEQPELCYTPFSFTANGGAEVIEKIDGSTLILSKYKGQLIHRTRGTVDASKIDNGYELEFLRDQYPKVFKVFDTQETSHWSYIFEWVSPVNRIVLNYGADPAIYLTAMINHSDYRMASQTSLDTMAVAMEVKRPQRFKFDKIKEMLEAIEVLKGQEGVCVYCNGGQDIRKVKSAWYLSCHRMKSELGSYERLVDFYFELNPNGYQEFYDYLVNNFDFEIAEAYRGDISRIGDGMKQVQQLLAAMKAKVETLRSIPRKDAAAAIHQAYGETNRASMAFTLLDGRLLDKDAMKKLLYQVTKD